MGNPTFFVDDAAVTAGETRVPLANFDNGCNPAASCSSGIGINIGGGALIGGTGITLVAGWPGSGGLEGTLPDNTIRDATNAANSGGKPVPGAVITPVGNASVVSLAAGWVSVP